MKKKKVNWRDSIEDIIERYLWAVGLALFVGGLIKLFNSIILIVVGIFLFLIGVAKMAGRIK